MDTFGFWLFLHISFVMVNIGWSTALKIHCVRAKMKRSIASYTSRVTTIEGAVAKHVSHSFSMRPPMKLSEIAAEVKTSAAFWSPAAVTSLGNRTPPWTQQTIQLNTTQYAPLTVCWNFQKLWLTLYLWLWHNANAMLCTQCGPAKFGLYLNKKTQARCLEI